MADLSARVGAARVSEHRLAAENEQLRREVGSWMDVGAKVMNREAHIVNAIRHSRSERTAPGLEPAYPAPVVLTEGRARGSNAGSFFSPLTAWIVIGVSVVVAFAYCFIQGDAATNQALMPALALGVVLCATVGLISCFMQTIPTSSLFPWIVIGCSVAVALVYYCMKPEAAKAPALLKHLMNRKKILELSEFQLEGLPAGFGEAYLLVQPSGGQDKARTRVEEQYEDRSVLRFGEVIPLSMKHDDGPCLVAVYRRDGEMRDTRIGSAELPASELLGPIGLGAQAPRQYYRFKVKPEALSPVKEVCIAMRIREVKPQAAGTQPKAYRSKHFNQIV